MNTHGKEIEPRYRVSRRVRMLGARCRSLLPARRKKPGSSTRWCRSPSGRSRRGCPRGRALRRRVRRGPSRPSAKSIGTLPYRRPPARACRRSRPTDLTRAPRPCRPAGRLAGALAGVGRVDRMPLAVDDARDLAFALGERVARAELSTNGPITLASFGLCTKILFGPLRAPRASISAR